MPIAYLGLGTNLGRRESHLRRALAALSRQAEILDISKIYETEPWGYRDQPAFLNLVVKVKTDLNPLALLDFIKNTETKLGRTPNFRYGPRKIDIDILLYDDLVFNHERLVLPHPMLIERAFVLIPLAEVAPNLVHPVEQCSILSLRHRISDTGVHAILDQVKIPQDMLSELNKNKTAIAAFFHLPPSHQNRYIHWVESAKHGDIRAIRLAQLNDKIVAQFKEKNPVSGGGSSS